MSRPLLLSLLSLLLAACAPLTPLPSRAFAPAQVQAVPLQVCWLETGGTTVGGGFGAGGWTRAERWEVTSSALLVRHPRGDLLIDAGLSPHAAQEGHELHGWGRFLFEQTAGRNELSGDLPAQLRALGVQRLAGVVLSHAHADHAGGLVVLPGVPVWVAPAEAEFIRSQLQHPTGVVMPAHARAMEARLEPIAFEAAPYETYASRWDVFGDGSVVVVPTPGHTPGSVATFVNLAPDRRLMHVGDLLNLEESLDRQVGKSWLMRMATDSDPGATETQVRTLLELHRLQPALTMLPAHDRPAWRRLFGDPGAGGLPPCIGATVPGPSLVPPAPPLPGDRER
jgi:N-acyl homoserine lactone hydrolase